MCASIFLSPELVPERQKTPAVDILNGKAQSRTEREEEERDRVCFEKERETRKEATFFPSTLT